MELISPPDLESRLLAAVRHAASVHIAVAYFNRVPALEECLAKVPDVQIVVSEEWEINNPEALLAVTKDRQRLKCIPLDAPGGRLHAKVIVGRRNDGSRFGFAGSANISVGALQTNRELVFALTDPDDSSLLDTLEEKVQEWASAGNAIDFKRALVLWRNRPRHAAPSTRATSRPGISDDVRYWILKSSAGSDGRCYWPEFKSESVLAIGWEDIGLDLRTASEAELERAIKAAYPDDSVARTMGKLQAFCREFLPGDRVMIIRGFNSTQDAPVYVYGFATVTGDFVFDKSSPWWKYKLGAAIEPVDAYAPVAVMRRLLQIGTCLETVHECDEARFRAVLNYFSDQMGMVLDQASLETMDLTDSGGVWERANPWLSRHKAPVDMQVVPSGVDIHAAPVDGNQGQWMTTPQPLSIAQEQGHKGTLSKTNRCRVRVMLRPK